MIDEKLYGYRLTEIGATNKFHPDLYEKYRDAFADLKSFGRKVGKMMKNKWIIFCNKDAIIYFNDSAGTKFYCSKKEKTSKDIK